MSGSENKANRSTSNKIFGDHIQQFLEKMMCSKEVSRFSRAKQPQRNVQKSYKILLWNNCRTGMCLPKILFPVFMFAFIFSLPLIFTLLAASISLFLTAAMKFSCFSSHEIRRLCFQSLALALSLLST